MGIEEFTIAGKTLDINMIQKILPHRYPFLLIDRIVEAKKSGLDAEVIKQAQDQHLRAHILWEWWTAENSDGFHNPEQARQSLAESIDASQKGIEILNKAISQKAAVK